MRIVLFLFSCKLTKFQIVWKFLWEGSLIICFQNFRQKAERSYRKKFSSCSIQSSDFDQSSQTLGEKTSAQLSKLHSTYPREIFGMWTFSLNNLLEKTKVTIYWETTGEKSTYWGNDFLFVKFFTVKKWYSIVTFFTTSETTILHHWRRKSLWEDQSN